MSALIETVRLPANLCPAHKGLEYVLLGDVSSIEQESKSILVPKSPSDKWLWTHFGLGSVLPALLVRCSGCMPRVRLTAHYYPGFHSPIRNGEWITVSPTGWRSRVGFQWEKMPEAEMRTWNVSSVNVSTEGLPYRGRVIELYKPGMYLCGDGVMYPNGPDDFLRPTTKIWESYCERRYLWGFLDDLGQTSNRMGELFSRAGETVQGLLSAISDARQGIFDSKRFAGSPNLAATRERLEEAVRECGFTLSPLSEKPPTKETSETSVTAKDSVVDSSLQLPYDSRE